MPPGFVKLYTRAHMHKGTWRAPTCIRVHGEGTCIRVQVWVLKDIRFGRDGNYDPTQLPDILITDELHRRRSEAAEAATAHAAVADHARLPPGAANGGSAKADPNSPEQLLLTWGVISGIVLGSRS